MIFQEIALRNRRALCGGVAALLLTFSITGGCGQESTESKHAIDVSALIGKSLTEIKTTLGSPSGDAEVPVAGVVAGVKRQADFTNPDFTLRVYYRPADLQVYSFEIRDVKREAIRRDRSAMFALGKLDKAGNCRLTLRDEPGFGGLHKLVEIVPADAPPDPGMPVIIR